MKKLIFVLMLLSGLSSQAFAIETAAGIIESLSVATSEYSNLVPGVSAMVEVYVRSSSGGGIACNLGASDPAYGAVSAWLSNVYLAKQNIMMTCHNGKIILLQKMN